MTDRDALARAEGLHNKFIVERWDGRHRPGEKHDGCQYLVLDLTHDVHALAAVAAYADAAERDRPAFVDDLRRTYLAANSRPDVGDLRLCEEGVTRRDEFQPCNRPAVALRNDPEAGHPYPVCKGHVRGDMVPLPAVLAALPAPVVSGDDPLRVEVCRLLAEFADITKRREITLGYIESRLAGAVTVADAPEAGEPRHHMDDDCEPWHKYGPEHAPAAESGPVYEVSPGAFMTVSEPTGTCNATSATHGVPCLLERGHGALHRWRNITWDDRHTAPAVDDEGGQE